LINRFLKKAFLNSVLLQSAVTKRLFLWVGFHIFLGATIFIMFALFVPVELRTSLKVREIIQSLKIESRAEAYR